MLVCETPQKTTTCVGTQSSVHSIYSDFQCWTGMHIIHATFAVAGSLLLVVLGLIITLTYYKSLNSANDASAKYDPRA